MKKANVHLPTLQPQIQVDCVTARAVSVKALGSLRGSEQLAHSPQDQPQEGRPEEAHQDPSIHTQLPAPRSSEHQGHPFQVFVTYLDTHSPLLR